MDYVYYTDPSAKIIICDIKFDAPELSQIFYGVHLLRLAFANFRESILKHAIAIHTLKKLIIYAWCACAKLFTQELGGLFVMALSILKMGPVLFGNVEDGISFRARHCLQQTSSSTTIVLQQGNDIEENFTLKRWRCADGRCKSQRDDAFFDPYVSQKIFVIDLLLTRQYPVTCCGGE